MKTYQKPETECAPLTMTDVMNFIETSVTTVPVGGYDDPDAPDLSNKNSVWDLREEEE